METSTVPAGSTSAAYSASAANEADVKSKPTIASDFETFLRMLTVQLENQDPLNPQKAEDFAVQLATFSNVEQAVYTNQLLAQFMSQSALGGVADLASWIGKQARAAVPMEFDGKTPIKVHVDPAAKSETSYLVVRNTDGMEVDRVPIAATDETVLWDGTSTSGATNEPGSYTFTVENWTDNGLDSVSKAEVYAEVVEARLEGGSAVLVFKGGNSIPASDVVALRGAPAVEPSDVVPSE